MRALVTGANGLLGAHLCRELLKAGHQVRALVRRTSNLKGLEGVDAEQVFGDVREAASMRPACEGVDVVFHAAAVFAYFGYARETMMQTAAEGTRTVLEAAKAGGAKRVVLTSSTAIFGGADEPRALAEGSPVVGDDAPDYFLSKAVQERSAVEKARELGLELGIANPSLFIGPHDYRPSTSLQTITGYMNDPLKLTYPGGICITHAADVARGHILIAERGEPFERYILGGDNVEWRAVHDTLSELLGVSTPRLKVGKASAYLGALLFEATSKVTGKPPLANRVMAAQVGKYFWYSSEKAKKLGYTSRPYRQTLAETIKWLLDSPHVSAAQRKKLAPAHEVLSAVV
jgi:dihydroflavonol-4-reductase